MQERETWAWLKRRILGLLTRPVAHDFSGNPVWANRLQAALLASSVTTAETNSQEG
jgi:hypothetical protein